MDADCKTDLSVFQTLMDQYAIPRIEADRRSVPGVTAYGTDADGCAFVQLSVALRVHHEPAGFDELYRESLVVQQCTKTTDLFELHPVGFPVPSFLVLGDELRDLSVVEMLLDQKPVRFHEDDGGWVEIKLI